MSERDLFDLTLKLSTVNQRLATIRAKEACFSLYEAYMACNEKKLFSTCSKELNEYEECFKKHKIMYRKEEEAKNILPSEEKTKDRKPQTKNS